MEKEKETTASSRKARAKTARARKAKVATPALLQHQHHSKVTVVIRSAEDGDTRRPNAGKKEVELTSHDLHQVLTQSSRHQCRQ